MNSYRIHLLANICHGLVVVALSLEALTIVGDQLRAFERWHLVFLLALLVNGGAMLLQGARRQVRMWPVLASPVLVALAVLTLPLAWTGTSPAQDPWVEPFILLAAWGARKHMHNLSHAKGDVAGSLATVKEPHFWVMSFLYVGTFGSFIGFSSVFPKLIADTFPEFSSFGVGAAALSLAFLGPLVGSVSRPYGGRLADRFGVQLVSCVGGTCAAARNIGAAASSGNVLCFVDADTIVPDNAVARLLQLHEDDGMRVVLYRLASREPGVRAWLWWTFWGLARHLPLARAKSMPAFMSCTRAHFMRYGPFDMSCTIAEEWPLTGAAYRYHPKHFLYDRSLTARTSSRRMELRPFGYARTFLKWASAVLFPWARSAPVDQLRHEAGSQ